ncbi:uncharacterized protein LOC126281304 [Schistocerca gregaria]|uniref:uncharacterized protein LOC126281304 n=1 Tax=Schistocerca gregaria TaxID=7010 RepID=UPI00211EA277|nr:uncharacterized protein LOC126281304 [Schistocerca gregaria]
MAALLVLVPLLCVAAVVGEPSCSLPPPSEEQFPFTMETKNWHVLFQYEAPDYQRFGCFALTQTSGENPYQLNINGSFSRQPDFPVSGTAVFKGNRMIKVYDGKWDKEFTGDYNVVYVDKDIFIDHFCYLGNEMAQIFTTDKEPSAEVLQRIWKVVDEHPEVEKSKFKEAIC